MGAGRQEEEEGGWSDGGSTVSGSSQDSDGSWYGDVGGARDRGGAVREGGGIGRDRGGRFGDGLEGGSNQSSDGRGRWEGLDWQGQGPCHEGGAASCRKGEQVQHLEGTEEEAGVQEAEAEKEAEEVGVY